MVGEREKEKWGVRVWVTRSLYCVYVQKRQRKLSVRQVCILVFGSQPAADNFQLNLCLHVYLVSQIG